MFLLFILKNDLFLCSQKSNGGSLDSMLVTEAQNAESFIWRCSCSRSILRDCSASKSWIYADLLSCMERVAKMLKSPRSIAALKHGYTGQSSVMVL